MLNLFGRSLNNLILVGLFICHEALCQWARVRTLDERNGLQGLEIIRLESIENAEDQTYLEQGKNLYLSLFSKAYAPYIHVFRSYFSDPRDLRPWLIQDFLSDEKFFHDPMLRQNFYFLEAVDPISREVLGLTIAIYHPEDRSLYVSVLAATCFQNSRGIGGQLLSTALALLPSVDTVRLIVVKENESAIRVYERWGFIRAEFAHPPYDRNLYMGMILYKAQSFGQRKQGREKMSVL